MRGSRASNQLSRFLDARRQSNRVSSAEQRDVAEAVGLKNAEGALVAQLEPNSPAAKGGIEAGDVITSVNSEPVKDSRDLARKIAAIAPGTSTKLGIFRNEQRQDGDRDAVRTSPNIR